MTGEEETKHQVQRKSCYQESFSSPVSTGNTCGHLIMMKLLQATINFSVSRVILHFFLRNKLRLKNCFFFQISLGLKWRSVPRGWLTKEHPLLKFPKIRANYLRGFGYLKGSRGALLHRHGKSRWQGMQIRNTYRVIHTSIMCTIFRCLGKEMKIHRDLFMMMLCVAG